VGTVWNHSAGDDYPDEQALLSYQQQEGLGVFACDAHLVLKSVRCQVGSPDYQSNIDTFIKHWGEIRKDGTYRSKDYVVKADPDTVFLPDRLKLRLQRLSTPAGASAYVENINFKYKFMAAFEVLTREAAELFLEHGDACRGHLGRIGSEDYYRKACLDALGADKQVDFGLLRDRYSDSSLTGCADKDSAAFHFYKQVPQWKACHNEALLASTKTE